jgi:transcriptional regulator with XRE-family HTH domain
MESIGSRIRSIRQKAGLTQTEFATRLDGVTRGAVGNWERDLGIKTENLRSIAQTFGVDFNWLVTGQGAPTREADKVPLVGKVGGGAVVYPIDDHAVGAGLDEVDAPPRRTPTMVAVQVEGDSMAAWNADDGSILYYDDRQEPPDPAMIGKIVIVWCEDERVLVKKLLSGSDHGLWSLMSSNGTIERDVPLRYAARVKFIEPR